MWTLAEPLLASVPMLPVRTPLVMDHAALGVLPLEIAQLTPEFVAPVGSASVTTRLLAAPAPVFVRLIVKPICCPALTVDASAVLVMPMPGQLTVIGTGPTLPLPSLLVEKLAELLTVPHVLAVVGLVM